MFKFSRILKIGTRGSRLAMTQARILQDKLSLLRIKSELVIINTTGDKVTSKPLYEIGGKALFLKEIEEALLKKQVDIGIHSMKDVPGEICDDLMISAIIERDDPRDVLISKYPNIESLPYNAKIGSSSIRREVQVKMLNPNVVVENLRGNIDSRLNKYLNGQYDAIILAAAGLKRLNITHDDFKILLPEIMLPAVGQGALAIEIRREDEQLHEVSLKLNNEQAWQEVQAERGFLETLQGDCKTPIGALAQMKEKSLNINYLYVKPDGTCMTEARTNCDPSKGYDIGKEVALDMLKK